MPVDLTLHQMPDPLFARLTASAKAHGRTVADEAIALLAESQWGSPVSPSERVARARALSKGLPADAFTPEDIDRFKREGRE